MKFTQYIKDNYVIKIDNNKIEQAIQGILYCINNNIQIFIIGNGGSAYSGSHFAQDLVKVCNAKASSLTDNIGLVTAFANDVDYASIFLEQLKRYNEQYLLIAISCSGCSKNIINAVWYTKFTRNLPAISFTSPSYEKSTLSLYTDLDICINAKNIFIGESIHSIIFHFIIDELKRRLNDN